MRCKIFKVLWLILAAMVMIALAVLLYIYCSTRNPVSGVLALDGLQDEVVVTRDQYGVPHIKADNDDDAFFALGFLHAQDRFWQMEFQRHIFKGTLSEMFGAATIEQDKFLRTLGFYRSAQQAWTVLSPQAKNIIHSYTKGVNSFLQHGNLPVQFQILRYTPQPWQDVDSIAWQKMMAWDLQNT
jgi:penicillin amidase